MKPTDESSPVRRPPGRTRLLSAMGTAMVLVISLVTVVIPLATPASADAGLSPAFVKTLGGPQHAEVYPGGVETSAIDNTIVVADTGNNQIAKYSQNGTQLWRIGSWGSGINQFDNPRDVGVDSAGNILVMDTRNSRIVKLSKDGAWLSTYNGSNTSLLINFPVGGSVSNNILYIADTGRKRVLAVNTSNFSVVREVVKNPGTQTTGLNTCNSFLDIRDADGDSAGNIYVAGYSYNQIAKVTPAGICTYWGSTGTGNGQFKTPYGVRVARDPVTGVDELFVADALNFRVQEFTLTGQFVAKFGVEGTPNQPGTITTMRRVAVATDGSGDVWAADLWGFQLERYHRTFSGYSWAQSIGTPLGASTDTSVFHEPRQIGIGPDGILNIIDTVHHRFVRMDTDGHIQRICGERASEGSTLGKFNWPRGLKVDEATGQIWVADTKQNRVQIINPDCSGVTYVGSGQGSGLSQLNWPYAIDIRQSDRIAFIADTENNRVVAYNVATRQAIGTYGSTGSGWNQMLKPQSIAVDPATGHLLIADTENNRIKVVSTTDGVNYTTLNNVDRGFNHPEGISTDAQGRIYVADSGNNQVVILNSAFEITGIFTGNGFNHPAGVTVSGQDLYVSDTYNDTVDVFTWNVPVPDKPAPYVRTLAGPFRGGDVRIRLRVRRHDQPAGDRRYRPRSHPPLHARRREGLGVRLARLGRRPVRESPRRRRGRRRKHLRRRRREQPHPEVQRVRCLAVDARRHGLVQRLPLHADRHHVGRREPGGAGLVLGPGSDQGVGRERRVQVDIARYRRERSA